MSKENKDVQKTTFDQKDYEVFNQKLKDELQILKSWFDQDLFDKETRCFGYELETSLVDQSFDPSPSNQELLERIADPNIVPELSRCNLEINAPPYRLEPDCFQKMYQNFQKSWGKIQKLCHELDISMVMIGCLPTYAEKHLSHEYISMGARYEALNQMLLNQHKGQKIPIDIRGEDEKYINLEDSILLESLATSLQIHFQTSPEKAVAIYNASLIASAACVALAANAPFLFGKSLWNESRIPIFEQVINPIKASDRDKRVGLGHDYVQESILELFERNLEKHPVLIPNNRDCDPNQLAHLRFHNGTIWRWNRPIIGVPDENGVPHLRIEHRTMSAGPSPQDCMAHVMFYIGLVKGLSEHIEEIQKKTPYETVLKNFYTACAKGLTAEISVANKTQTIQDLLIKEWVPICLKGLEKLKISKNDSDHFINGIILPRVKSLQTGSAWQQAFITKHGKDFHALVENYLDWQERDIPVHMWTL